MNRLSVELMLEKQSSMKLISVSPEDSILKAAQLLKENDVGILVVQIKDDLVGVLSKRDILHRWICGPKFPKEVTVGELMTKNVEVITTNDTIKDCYLRFLARNCRHLPVIDPMGRVAGILSLRDMSNYVLSKLD